MHPVPPAAPAPGPASGLVAGRILQAAGAVASRLLLVIREEIDSTNLQALRLAEGTAPEGTVVIAERQTAGRGRHGRVWRSPPGNIYLSLILRPKIPAGQLGSLTLLAAAATARAVEETLGLKLEIKWPNDLELDGRKLGGVLAEARTESARIPYAVVGIGLNAHAPLEVFAGEIDRPVTSLDVAMGVPIDRDRLIGRVLGACLAGYDDFCARGPAAGLDEWNRRSATAGRLLRVELAKGTIEGWDEGVDEEGRLILRLPGEGTVTRRVAAGEVLLLRAEGARR